MTDTQNEMAKHGGLGSRLRILAIGRHPKKTLVRASVLALACVIVFKFVLLPVRVEGISMAPTYSDHSVNFINRLSFLWHEPRRGDVVAIRLNDPNGSAPHIMYLKRIIGLPGETIAFVNGAVLVNGVRLDEPYEKWPCNWNIAPVRLGADEYFVVGDNRRMAHELHVFGVRSRSRIVGKALL